MPITVTFTYENAQELLYHMQGLTAGAPECAPTKPATTNVVDFPKPVSAQVTVEAETPTDEKPTSYRGGRADEIGKALCDKAAVGEGLSDDELDDLSRLPRKWQAKVEGVLNEAAKAAKAAESDVPADTVDAAFSLHNDDGSVADTFDTAEEWVGAMIEKVKECSSADELRKVAEANRGAVTAIVQSGVDQAVLRPATEAYAAQMEGLKDAGPTEDEAEAETSEADAEVPTVDDVRAATKAMLSTVGEKVAFGLLKEFGAAKASDVTENNRAVYIAKAQAKAAGAAALD